MQEAHCRRGFETRTFSPQPTHCQGLAWSPSGYGVGVAPPSWKSFRLNPLLPRSCLKRSTDGVDKLCPFPTQPNFLLGLFGLEVVVLYPVIWQSQEGSLGQDEGSDGFRNSPALNPSLGAHSRMLCLHEQFLATKFSHSSTLKKEQPMSPLHYPRMACFPKPLDLASSRKAGLSQLCIS